MIDLKLPAVGHVAIGGHDSNHQGGVVQDLAGQHLAAGGSVCALVDMNSQGQGAEGAMADWCRAAGVGLGAMDRFTFLSNSRTYKTSDDLQTAIRQKLRKIDGHPLIVNDLSRGLALMPGASWLSRAEELALLMDCLVLTAFGFGPSPTPAPNLEQYKHIDALWTCEEGLSLALVLKRIRPNPELIVKLKGKVMPYGVLAFENVEQPEGFSHVA